MPKWSHSLATKNMPWIPPSCQANADYFKLRSKAENSSALIGCPKEQQSSYEKLYILSFEFTIQEMQEVCSSVGISNHQIVPLQW